MKTIQMTIDEALLTEVDEAVQLLNTNRSAFMREALQIALKRLHLEKLERKHRQGYMQHPITSDEFDLWQDEQVWEEAA